MRALSPKEREIQTPSFDEEEELVPRSVGVSPFDLSTVDEPSLKIRRDYKAKER